MFYYPDHYYGKSYSACRIGIVNEDGSVSSVYCKEYGSILDTGPILEEFYCDTDLVNEMISLGNMDFVAKHLHPIPDSTELYCAFYKGRNGWTDQMCQAKQYSDEEEFFAKFPDGYEVSRYAYLWNGSYWLVCFRIHKDISPFDELDKLERFFIRDQYNAFRLTEALAIVEEDCDENWFFP